MRTIIIVAAATLCLGGSLAHAQQEPKEISFTLTPIKSILQCLSNDGSEPRAYVKVRRGRLADTLQIHVSGLKPKLQFDLFTVQRSPLDAQGSPVADFPGFGLAWYQTDLEANGHGEADATIRTILLDQIFGFDGDKRADGSTILAPTNTFHVGFWFNNPQDAAACGFDVTKPTPFNGEHKAGPLAMISTPEPDSGLGPLCTRPTGASPDDATKLPCNP
jgi:hypothetical protein